MTAREPDAARGLDDPQLHEGFGMSSDLSPEVLHPPGLFTWAASARLKHYNRTVAAGRTLWPDSLARLAT